MSIENISIGDAELVIMKVLWKANKSLNSQAIGEKVAHKNWKRTTISTFLTRLVEKGALKSEKIGNTYYYTPLISSSSYKKAQTKNLIKNLYNGSVVDFAMSLFEDEKLSNEDIKELKAIFDCRKE
ncbi:MAG: BlaI/MecI/CopY family transcriptional regulator [Ruminococcaceae bacterium]|nr:BlaI/MecI/CopY family transcriptional regulator [Oscillospiraceae bacterium]